jgi:hypothetical protein
MHRGTTSALHGTLVLLHVLSMTARMRWSILSLVCSIAGCAEPYGYYGGPYYGGSMVIGGQTYWGQPYHGGWWHWHQPYQGHGGWWHWHGTPPLGWHGAPPPGGLHH